MSDKNVSDLAIDYATDILKALEDLEIPPSVSYASLGSAFSRMHIGMGFCKEEWLENCKEMGELLFVEIPESYRGDESN